MRPTTEVMGWRGDRPPDGMRSEAEQVRAMVLDMPTSERRFKGDVSEASTRFLDFELPTNLEASEPPEARALARDEVRLMVTREGDTDVDHVRFRDLPNFMEAGDLVVINTSATRNAAVDALRQDGTPVVVHLSTRVRSGSWVVELRQPAGYAA